MIWLVVSAPSSDMSIPVYLLHTLFQHYGEGSGMMLVIVEAARSLMCCM